MDNAIGNGEVLYLKGQLRVVTTLAFLAVVHQKNASLKEAVHLTAHILQCKTCIFLMHLPHMCPRAQVDKEVHSSLQHVMALGVKLTDRKEELFCGSSCGKDFLDALCH